MQEQLTYYKEREKEINARPIKKVLEANARKQKRKTNRLAKAKRRAENVLNNESMEHGEKVKEMKR